MSTESIFGGWDTPRLRMGDHGHLLQKLWHALAAHPGEPNFGLSQRKHEIIPLWMLYEMQAPEVVLEIGTAQGGSFASWCQLGHPKALLISIDRDTNDARPRPDSPGNRHIYSGPLSLTQDGGGLHSLRRKQQTVKAINGWSYEEKTLKALDDALRGRLVNFLFHDASHSAEMFATDFGLYWPLIAPGGIFAAHDIMPSAHPDCNKSEAWERIKETAAYSACFEFKSSRNDDSMGIGVLIK